MVTKIISGKTNRRIKQRAENPVRAKLMSELRLCEQNAIPYEYLSNAAPIHVGCSGWFYWDWKEIFYPTDLPTSQWFNYYAQHFNTVELNVPFYSWPALATVKSWMRQARNHPNFIYTIKVSELITHIKRFVGTKTLIKDFNYIADLMGASFGCFLFQLPPNYLYTPARLNQIMKQLDPNRRNIVEFRHPSWWNEKVFAAFKAHHIIFCSVSSPTMPNDLIVTTDEIYLRFHGTAKMYRHDYSEIELDLWLQKIDRSHASRVWCYFNNAYDGFAINNAKKFLSGLNKLGKFKTV